MTPDPFSLSEILRAAQTRLLDATDPDAVVVMERGDDIDALNGQAARLLRSCTSQVRLSYHRGDSSHDYGGLFKCEARTWIGASWSEWREPHWRGGDHWFTFEDAIATDWRFVEGGEDV